MEHAEVGDILRFHRGEYSHLAVYAGQGTVIHLWSPTSHTEFAVRIDSIRHVRNCHGPATGANDSDDGTGNGGDRLVECCTRELDERMLHAHDVSPMDGADVVRRARSRLGETRYDYLNYNCEHFVTWARYGIGESPQATSHTNHVLAGALLGAVVGGVAGMLIGGAISLVSKVNALSVSSSGRLTADSEEEEEDEDRSRTRRLIADATVVAEQDEAGSTSTMTSDGGVHHRRQDRERLLNNISAIRLPDDATNTSAFEDWAQARQRSRRVSSSRTYSDDRHNALATRLADNKMRCGICFYDLQHTRALAFPCDHFTCAKCHDALVSNVNGQKCCPYCRMHISETQIIHRSTKLEARERITWDDYPSGVDTASVSAEAASPGDAVW